MGLNEKQLANAGGCPLRMVLAPTNDLRWLRAWQYRWQKAAEPREKRSKMVHAKRLVALGLQLMDAAPLERTRGDRARAYRDGLLLAFLAARPLRRRTLALLQVGRHVNKVGQHYFLSVSAAETKTAAPLDFPLLKRLSIYLDRYLEHFRPMFAGAAQHAHLWPSARGGALRDDAIYQMVCRRTGAAFGTSERLYATRAMETETMARFGHSPANSKGLPSASP